MRFPHVRVRRDDYRVATAQGAAGPRPGRKTKAPPSSPARFAPELALRRLLSAARITSSLCPDPASRPFRRLRLLLPMSWLLLFRRSDTWFPSSPPLRLPTSWPLVAGFGNSSCASSLLSTRIRHLVPFVASPSRPPVPISWFLFARIRHIVFWLPPFHYYPCLGFSLIDLLSLFTVACALASPGADLISRPCRRPFLLLTTLQLLFCTDPTFCPLRCLLFTAAHIMASPLYRALCLFCCFSLLPPVSLLLLCTDLVPRPFRRLPSPHGCPYPGFSLHGSDTRPFHLLNSLPPVESISVGRACG